MIGLATRLYLAIGGAVVLVLAVSLFAYFALIEVQRQQTRVAEQSLPVTTEAMTLGELGASLAATTPRVLSVADQEERQVVTDQILSQTEAFATTLAQLRDGLGQGAENFSDLDGLGAVLGDQAAALLDEVDAALVGRAELQTLIRRAARAHAELLRRIDDARDDELFFLATGFRALDQLAPTPPEARLTDARLAAIEAVGTLLGEGNLMFGLTLHAATLNDADRMGPIIERYSAASASARRAIGRTTEPEAWDAPFTALEQIALGPAGVFSLRADALVSEGAAQRLVGETSATALSVAAGVKRVTALAQDDTADAVEVVRATVAGTRAQLFWLNALSVLGALVIGFFFVRRSFTQPLSVVTKSAARYHAGDFSDTAVDAVARRPDEIGTLAKAFMAMAREFRSRAEVLDRLVKDRTRELDDKNRTLEETLKRIQAELDMAREMQMSLLPSRFPRIEGLDVFGSMHAAREVGGDFFDTFELPDGRLCFAIADVADKGVPAALVMATCYARLRAFATDGAAPELVLARLNDELAEDNDSTMFVTALLGVVDPARREVTLLNAGHEPPCIIDTAGAVHCLALPANMAMGVLGGQQFEPHVLSFDDFKALFLYTDGITEAFDAYDAQFSLPRLEATLSAATDQTAQCICDGVVEAVLSHQGVRDQSDDLTCLALVRM